MWSCFNGSLFELVYLQLPYCSDVKGELESFRRLFRRIRILMGPAESSRTLSCRTFVSPGHNQIWICNFLQSDWRKAQLKHWRDRERTKLDRNVEQGNFEANSCRVLWVECTLKKSNSNTQPINRDHFMRHSVRFTNIEMLMIENAFCKHPWISDNISRDQKQLDDSDRIGRIGNLNTAIHCKWKGFKKSCLE